MDDSANKAINNIIYNQLFGITFTMKKPQSRTLVVCAIVFNICGGAYAATHDKCEFHAFTANTAAQWRQEGISMVEATEKFMGIFNTLETLRPETKEENGKTILSVGWVYMYSLPPVVAKDFVSRTCRQESNEPTPPLTEGERVAICKLYGSMAYGAVLNKNKKKSKEELIAKIYSHPEIHEKTMLRVIVRGIENGFAQNQTSPERAEENAFFECMRIQ